MVSSLLLQEVRQAEEPAWDKLGVRIVSVEASIDSIVVSRAQERGAHPSENDQFVFDVNLSESNWTEVGLGVKYSFRFGKARIGQECEVSGRALVQFSRFDPTTEFETLGNDIINEIVVDIFRKDYEAVYLLLDALGMEKPSPWITQDISLSSRSLDGDAGQVRASVP
jgi:hypothetical protein